MALKSLRSTTLQEWAQSGLHFYQDFYGWLRQLEREYPPGRSITPNQPTALGLQATLEMIDDARPRIVEKLKQVTQPKENTDE